MAKKKLSPTAGQDMAAYIRAHLGEVMSYITIDEICGTTSSNQQFLIVGSLVKDGVLRVSQRKLIRGNDDAPIYRSYHICKKLPQTLKHSAAFMEGNANMGVLDEAVADLNPVLTENGFLSKHLDAAKGWHEELLLLGAWLSKNEGPLAPAILEERSFEVFHNEKILGNKDDRRGGKTLMELVNNTGVAERLYLDNDVQQELVYYVPRTMRRVISILVVENHAPFVRVKTALKRGVRSFFGRHIDGVIYGRGFAILSGDALRTTEDLFANGCAVRYWYWGDIDRPGIEVYERLAEEHDIRPLVEAYQAMIRHAGSTLPASTGERLPTHMGVDIASELEPSELEMFMRVVAGCLRIPQEAVPASTYDGSGGTRRLAMTLRPRRSSPRRGK